MLRVVFVLLVVLYHSTFIGPSVYHAFVPKKLFFAHQVGASLLLVLSAYFVAVTLPKGPTARWWWAKMARILPPFAVATVMAWTALHYFAPDGFYFPSVGDLFRNMLMLWEWNGRWHVDYVDGSYWTIPVQLMAFTVAALVWRTRFGSGRGLRVLLWVGLLVPLAQLSLHWSMPPDSLYGSIVDGFGLHRWHLFVAGVTVWMLATRRIGRVHGGGLLVGCLVAHVAHTGWFNDDGSFGFDHVAVVWIGLGMLALVAAAVGPDWDRWVPARVQRVITWLAGISYGVFLCHQTTGYVLTIHLQDHGLGPTLQTLVMIANAILLGWLLTRFVEGPAHRGLMAFWDHRAPTLRARLGLRNVRVRPSQSRSGVDPADGVTEPIALAASAESGRPTPPTKPFASRRTPRSTRSTRS